MPSSNKYHEHSNPFPRSRTLSSLRTPRITNPQIRRVAHRISVSLRRAGLQSLCGKSAPAPVALTFSPHFSNKNRKRLPLHGITLLSRKKSCQEGEQPYENRVYPVCLRISSPKTTRDSGPVR